eukprot:s1087_g5.t1
MAAGSLEARRGSVDVFPLSRVAGASVALSELCDPTEVVCAEPRLSHDDPEWIGEIADSLPFREVLRYKFLRPGHINVLEARMYKTFQKYCARRSSSPALSRVLQGTLPYTLGSGLYSGGLHVYSSKNRADGPSRNRALEPPTKEVPVWYSDLCAGKHWRFDVACAANRADGPSRNRALEPPTKEVPVWYSDLCAGKHWRFDVACAASRCSKLRARWLRLLLLLGGDIERNPGPSRSARLVPRGPLDLRSGFTATTADRMRRCLDAFMTWVLVELQVPFAKVSATAESLALALRGYGLYLYSSGHPRYLFVYAITAIQDRFPAFHGQMAPAWQIDRKWQHLEPSECGPVLSAAILRAMVALGLVWGWPRFVGVLLIGFLCMLHPAEYLSLTRADLLLPTDVLTKDRVAYDTSVLHFLEAAFESLPFDAMLYPGTKHTFKSQWNAILARLGIPYKQIDKGITPGVLRGSGATHMYLETEDLSRVAWRGRWSRQKTLEFYVQEVAAQMIVQRLPEDCRHRIVTLDQLSNKLLSLYISSVAPSSEGS